MHLGLPPRDDWDTLPPGVYTCEQQDIPGYTKYVIVGPRGCPPTFAQIPKERDGELTLRRLWEYEELTRPRMLRLA